MSCKVHPHDAACVERECEILSYFLWKRLALNAPPSNDGIGGL